MRYKQANYLLRYAICIVLTAIILATLAGCGSNKGQASKSSPTQQPGNTSASDETSDENLKKGKDLVIQVRDISDKAKFYPLKINGIKLEVLAVKAPDGSIRTAFNTCQVCYASGRGYYKQEGNTLVCQNCGNRFTMDRVEVESGGCNPVPIFSQYKTVKDDTITIPYDFLNEAKTIFSNWKTEY